jgi:hypothetical protein
MVRRLSLSYIYMSYYFHSDSQPPLGKSRQAVKDSILCGIVIACTDVGVELLWSS